MSIPPLIVSGALLYAAAMWWVSRRRTIRMDTRIFSVVLASEAVMYLAFSLIDIPISVRAFAVRLSLIVIALSQAIPLHISYWRSVRR
jgi:hypothetical protein